MLDLPELLAPKNSVMGAMRMAPVSLHPLKFRMRRCSSTSGFLLAVKRIARIVSDAANHIAAPGDLSPHKSRILIAQFAFLTIASTIFETPSARAWGASGAWLCSIDAPCHELLFVADLFSQLLVWPP